MQKMAMLIGRKTDKAVEYNRPHANAWPDILDLASGYSLNGHLSANPEIAGNDGRGISL